VTIALQLHQRLQISEYKSRGLAEALSGLDEGAIILDRSNRPLVVNARAARILEEGDGLSLAAGSLRASTDALTNKLCDAIAVAGASTTREGKPLYLPMTTPGSTAATTAPIGCRSEKTPRPMQPASASDP